MSDQPDIVLYTANTMNGWKPLIFLHEAEVDYELVPLSVTVMPKPGRVGS